MSADERGDLADCMLALLTRRPMSVLVRSGLYSVDAYWLDEARVFEFSLTYALRGEQGTNPERSWFVRHRVPGSFLLPWSPTERRCLADLVMVDLGQCIAERFSG